MLHIAASVVGSLATCLTTDGPFSPSSPEESPLLLVGGYLTAHLLLKETPLTPSPPGPLVQTNHHNSSPGRELLDVLIT